MKEALKLALEALEPDVYRAEWAVEQDREKAITAIKAALAQPEQEPVAWVTKRNVIVDGLWEEEITFSEFDDGGDPVYYTPPQPEERNFCPRCGKRTADLTVIHTCTPPQRKPLTDDEIWEFWCSRPEISEGEDDSMEAEFVTSVRAVLAAHGIKEKNT